jgi:hypothetical protein
VKMVNNFRQAKTQIKQEGEDVEPYSELRMELLKEKDNMPMLIPEASVVNPNAALGTPPRLMSDGENEHDMEDLTHEHDMGDGRECPFLPSFTFFLYPLYV